MPRHPATDTGRSRMRSPSTTASAAARGAAGKGRAKCKAEEAAPRDRERLIAETAYFIAERRGFAPGGELDDWLQAEAAVDGALSGAGRQSQA